MDEPHVARGLCASCLYDAQREEKTLAFRIKQTRAALVHARGIAEHFVESAVRADRPLEESHALGLALEWESRSGRIAEVLAELEREAAERAA